MSRALSICSWLLVLLCLAQVSAAYATNEPTKTYLVATEADDVVTRVIFDDVAYHFNIDIEYVNYPSFDSILKSVETGKSDFAANVTFTPEREGRFSFSRPTNIEYTYLFSKKQNRLEDMSVVGVPAGTIYGDLIKENYPKIKLVEYFGSAHAQRLLEFSTVDGTVDAINQLKPMLLKGFNAQLLNDQLSIQPVSIITPLGKHQELLNQIEHYVHSAKVQKLLRESIQKYQFDLRKHALRQAVIDGGINLQRPLKIKLENVPPYTIYSPDGEVSGISADIVFKACDILLLKCELASTASESWESMYNDIRQNKIDIIAPLTITEPRKKLVYFSDSYYHPEAILVKREGYKDFVYSNVSELVAERIGVVKDDFFEELLSRMLPRKTLITVPAQSDLIEALYSEKVDYIVMSRGNFNQFLRESDDLVPFVEDTMIGSFYSFDTAIGFAKTPFGETLSSLFSRAIKMMDIQKIVKTYDYRPDWRATLVVQKRFTRHSQWLFLIAMALLVTVALYLHQQSNTDNLTKLRNRRALYRRYKRGIAGKCALVYLDLNHFKQINDNYGHEIGDKVLKQLSQRIAQVWKGRAYRIGGDEFVLVGNVKAAKLEELRTYLQRFIFVDVERDVSFEVTTAVGMSVNRDRYMSLQDVMHQADQAMYEEKHKRQNVVTPIRPKQQGSQYN